MQNLFIFDQRRSNIHISVTDDQKLEASRARTTLRCESNFSVWPPSTVSIFFTMSKAANHVRVASADMPYRGAKFHGRGLKIYLCRLLASTGALNAAEIYVKKKRNSFGRF